MDIFETAFERMRKVEAKTRSGVEEYAMLLISKGYESDHASTIAEGTNVRVLYRLLDEAGYVYDDDQEKWVK